MKLKNTPLEGKIVFGNEWNPARIKSIDISGDSRIELTSIKKLDDEYDNGQVSIYGGLEKVKLDLENGLSFFKNKIVSGYDESILSFDALEGVTKATSHSVVSNYENKWRPTCYLTLNIYTNSEILVEKNPEAEIRYSKDDLSVLMAIDYLHERKVLLNEIIKENSILFIDGPLFSGRHTDENFKLIEELLNEKNILTFFLKKGCTQTSLKDNFHWAKKYNSDIHWANTFLGKIESIRTPFFKYSSFQENTQFRKREKVFTYLKNFKDRSPVRIEFDFRQYAKIKKEDLDSIMDMISYLYFVDGNRKSPQVRHIAVAEKYARETLKSTNIYKTVNKYGLTPTQNELRF